MFRAHTVCVQRDPVMRLCVLRARACGVSAVVCVGAPLRARLTHEITHLDGRAVGLYIIYIYIYIIYIYIYIYIDIDIDIDIIISILKS